MHNWIDNNINKGKDKPGLLVQKKLGLLNILLSNKNNETYKNNQ